MKEIRKGRDYFPKVELRIILLIFLLMILTFPLSAHISIERIMIAQSPIVLFALMISFLFKKIVLKIIKKPILTKLLIKIAFGELFVFYFVLFIFLTVVFRVTNFYPYLMLVVFLALANYFLHYFILSFNNKKVAFTKSAFLLFILSFSFIVAYLIVFLIFCHFRLFGWTF
jgi:hypothetical protein